MLVMGIGSEIANRVVERALIRRAKASATVDAAMEALKPALADGDRIEVRGFGVFKVKRRKHGFGRNPKTDIPVAIPPGHPMPRPDAEYNENKALRAVFQKWTAQVRTHYNGEPRG